MKKNILSIILGLIVSSCNFLEYSEYTSYDKDDVYTSFNRVKESLTNIYSYLPSAYGTIGGAMRAAACDEAVYIDKLSSVHSFNNGSWSAINTVDNNWHLFNAIRAANLFLEEVRGQEFDELKHDPNYQYTMEQFKYYPYEARFLRAYYHFELAKRYGNIPIITSVLTTEQANTIKREPFDKVIEFIVEECEKIAPNLPISYSTIMSAEVGRITRGAAMALKSRALLYAASKLFNPENNKEKWVRAAQAAGEFIQQANTLGYSLASLDNLWNKTYAQNTELILGVMQTPDNSFEAQNFPVGIDGGGNTGHCPTQNLVDAFEMQSTGLPITDTEYSTADPSYDPTRPYERRDPRLNATIALNNTTWVYGEPLQSYQGGRSGKPVKNATETGYYLKKYVDGSTSLRVDNISSKNHIWTLFRYSEILLNYAEAMIEAYGDYNYKNAPIFPLSAKEAVDVVRAREGVNMPPFPVTLTPEQFMAKLRNERRVELAFEDHRFWDIRRWKIAEEEQTIYGVDIIRAGQNFFTYQKIEVEKRLFEEKMYLYPIPDSERMINPGLGQNPGW